MFKWFQKVKDFFTKLVLTLRNFKKPLFPQPLPQPVDTKPEVKPVDPVPVVPTPVETHPNVVDALLGGTPHPQNDAQPVQESDYNYSDGTHFDGAGHVLRNKMSPDQTMTFTFDLPEGKTSYQVDVLEISGTPDSMRFKMWTEGEDGLEHPTEEFQRGGSQAVAGTKAGPKKVNVLVNQVGPLGAVVYF